MSYRMDLANRAGLFRKYAQWHEAENNFNKTTHQSIIYSISTLMLSIESIHSLKNECIDQYKLFENKVVKKTKKTYFRSPSLDNIFIHLSTTITNLRILQNTIIQILPREKNADTTNSMSEFYKRKDKCTYLKKNTEIINIITNYWEKHGMQVKHYRDFEQHFGVMYSNAWINKDNFELIIILPDNPEQKSSQKLKYEKNIDAISFINEQFYAIHELLENISEILGFTTEQVFDYNMLLKNDKNDIMAIQIDPTSNLIICLEGHFDDDKMKGLYHLSEGLDKYSFIKSPIFFENKFSMKKDYIISNEPIECISVK